MENEESAIRAAENQINRVENRLDGQARQKRDWYQVRNHIPSIFSISGSNLNERFRIETVKIFLCFILSPSRILSRTPA